MRTTLDLDDELLKQAKLLAVQSGSSLTALIEDALRERLSRSRSVATSERIHLPVSGKGGLQPGVDLDDSAALRDLMDAAP